VNGLHALNKLESKADAEKETLGEKGGVQSNSMFSQNDLCDGDAVRN